ncbi:MAG: NF038122 family metalloprotease [Planctomycetaceae bacterium]
MRKNRMMCGGCWVWGVLLLLVPWSAVQGGIIFNFTDNTTGGMSSAALAAFNRAGLYYSSRLSDNMTVNLDIRIVALGAGILGEATPAGVAVNYATFRSAVTATANLTSAADAAFAAGLPAGNSFSLYVNHTIENLKSATPYVDNDGSVNNSSVVMTRANAKALGLIAGGSPVKDGSIEFNSAFAWDFDPTDGIDSDKIDFTAVAAHEIGHALGFFQWRGSD